MRRGAAHRARRLGSGDSGRSAVRGGDRVDRAGDRVVGDRVGERRGCGARRGSAEASYPEVDISKLVVQEFPAGTPQTTATVAPTSGNALVAGRALASDYVEKEFQVRGEATTYRGGLTSGPVEVTKTNVPIRRVLVHYPKDASKFSGRVVIEPFNTSSGGKDYDVVWSLLAPLLQERGDAWVGVTERTSAGQRSRPPIPPAMQTLTSRATTWRGMCSHKSVRRYARADRRARYRASSPSTSTWPATRRAASTPRGSRSGWRSTTARRRASRCSMATSRRLRLRAPRRSRPGHPCCRSSSTRCGQRSACPS